MNTKTVLIITFLLSFCFAQESAEDWFIQARCYEMAGRDSLALKACEEAYKKDSSSFLKNVLLIRYLRADQFEKALKISKEVRVDLDEYKDGNKVAEFYCYIQKIPEADSLWQQLIYNAVGAHQLDSALILANSFAKNIPRSVPRMMQAYLMKILR